MKPGGHTHLDFIKWCHDKVSPARAEGELWWRYMRMMCRRNLWFLAYEVLGFEDLDETFHGAMCKRGNSWPYKEDGHPFPYMADFWPRGGFKTTLFSVARCIQLVLRCPEETIMIEHGQSSKGIAILRGIKQHLEGNELLRWLFPDIIYKHSKDSPKWTVDEATLKRKGNYREATFTVSSPEAGETGGHYTYLNFDDLVCEPNVKTLDQMDKIHTHFKGQILLRDERRIRKDGPLWWPWMEEDQRYDKKKRSLHVFFRQGIIATRWHLSDSNSKLIDPRNDEFAGDVDVNIVKAINENGESFFPQRFPMHELKRVRKSLGPLMWSAQMMQDPHPEDDQIFKRSYFPMWSTSDLPDKLWYYTTVDLNNKGAEQLADLKKRPDWGVTMTTGSCPIGNRYIMRIDREYFTPKEHIRSIINHVQLYKPKALGIESSSYQESFVFWLIQEAEAMGVKLPRIIKIMRGGRGKDNKHKRIIEAIEPPAADHRIFIGKHIKHRETFLDEAEVYPRGNDDMLDTLADMLNIAQNPLPIGAWAAGEKLPEDIDPNDQSLGMNVLTNMGVNFGSRRNLRRKQRA